MSEQHFSIAHLDQLEALPADEEGLVWRPVRRHFGIEAFGVNAYTAAEPGHRVVEEHAEKDSGHDELYFVARGHARFTLADEEVDAPAGTFVFVPSSTRRGAVASEAGTTVLAMGGRRGQTFEVSKWETTFAAYGYHRLGDTERGLDVLRDALARDAEDWNVHYHLACLYALSGSRDAALEHLTRAAELEPKAREWAREDSDLDSIRDHPRFPG